MTEQCKCPDLSGGVCDHCIKLLLLAERARAHAEGKLEGKAEGTRAALEAAALRLDRWQAAVSTVIADGVVTGDALADAIRIAATGIRSLIPAAPEVIRPTAEESK